MVPLRSVVRTADLAERLHDVLLPHLHRDDRAGGQVLDERAVLGQHAFVDVEELLSDGLVEHEQLQRGDLVAAREDHVDGPAHVAFLVEVRLEHAAAAVREGRSRPQLRGRPEEEVQLALR